MILIIDSDGPSCAWCPVDDPTLYSAHERAQLGRIMARWTR